MQKWSKLWSCKKCKNNYLSYHIIQAKVKYSIQLLQHNLKKLLYCQKVVVGGGGKNDANVFFFWSLREDSLKEVHKIKKQNLKLGQCIIQKFYL